MLIFTRWTLLVCAVGDAYLLSPPPYDYLVGLSALLTLPGPAPEGCRLWGRSAGDSAVVLVTISTSLSPSTTPTVSAGTGLLRVARSEAGVQPAMHELLAVPRAFS